MYDFRDRDDVLFAYLSNSDSVHVSPNLTVFFGLGNACEADVTIRWPDGTLSTETMHLEGNRRWKVVQGSPAEVATP